MFFYVGDDCPIQSVNQVSQRIFLDQGWKKHTQNNTTYYFKGYSTDCDLNNSIDDIISGYRPKGKWCVISQEGIIYHPTLRGFPIYINNNNLTNIPLENFTYKHYEFEEIYRPDTKITIEEASEKINSILQENVHNFFKYNKIDRIRVLFTGGIDSMTVWSIIDNLSYDYDLYIHLPKSNDIFGVKEEYKSDLIDLCREKFWGYKMTSCFNDENWYSTGFYSEVIQIREVSQGHAIANYKNKKLHELPNKKDYLYYFLQRPSCKINNSPTFTNESDLIDWCNKTVFNDHQMWHIDNNFHFSPFNDLRITEIMNQLSLDDIVHNAFTAIIQKNIISFNRPDFLTLLSDYKNEGMVWKNYRKNFSNIVLRESIKKYIS